MTLIPKERTQDEWYIKFRDEIRRLEAELAAHIENDGDECPLCVCEAENDWLMTVNAKWQAENKRLSGALYDAMCLQVEHDDEIFSDITLDHDLEIAKVDALKESER